MKNGFWRISFVVLTAIMVVLTGCPVPGDSNGGDGGKDGDDDLKFNGMIYSEGLNPLLADPLYWQGDNGFSIGDHTENPQDGSVSLKIDWSKATAWNGLEARIKKGSVDLSGYDALTFYARGDRPIDKVGFNAGDPKELSLSGVNVTSTWQKFILPLPDPEKMSSVVSLFFAVSDVGPVLYVDSVQFEKLGNITVDSLTYTRGDIVMPKDSKQTVPSVTAVFDAGGTKISNVIGGSESGKTFRNHLTWTSSDETVATIDSGGNISALALGDAVITGALGTKSITLNVTVGDPEPFTGGLYDDALLNGFFAGYNGNIVGEGQLPIDSTDSTVGGTGTSIKIDVSSNTEWGGGFLSNDNGVDASAYNVLKFAMDKSNMDSNLNFMEFKLEDTASNAYSMNLFSFGPVSSSGSWEFYEIPLTAGMGIDFSQFKAVGFWNPKIGGDQGTFSPGVFYLDDLSMTTIQLTPFTGTLYDSGLSGGFTAGSDGGDNGGSITIDSTDSTVDGTGTSLKIDLASESQWGGAYIINDFGVDASGYGVLKFAIDTSDLDSTVDFIQVKLEDTAGNVYTTNFYSLTEVKNAIGDWKFYEIPFSSAIGVNFGQFKGIGFWNPTIGGETGTFSPGVFHLDEIILEQGAARPTFDGEIFGDALSNGFSAKYLGEGVSEADWPTDTGNKATGTTSLKLDMPTLGFTGAWGGAFLLNTNGVNATGHTNINFAVDVTGLDNTVDYIELKLEDTFGGAFSTNLYSLTEVSTTGNWKFYTIPLTTATGVNFAQFKAIGFWHPKAGGDTGTFTPGTLSVDDIKFD